MKHKQDRKVQDKDKVNNLSKLFYFISGAKSPWPITNQKPHFLSEHSDYIDFVSENFDLHFVIQWFDL